MSLQNPSPDMTRGCVEKLRHNLLLIFNVFKILYIRDQPTIILLTLLPLRTITI